MGQGEEKRERASCDNTVDAHAGEQCTRCCQLAQTPETPLKQRPCLHRMRRVQGRVDSFTRP